MKSFNSDLFFGSVFMRITSRWLAVCLLVALATVAVSCLRKGGPYVWESPPAPPGPPASGENLRLAWDPPATNTDGTPLTDLAGYRLYWGSTSGQYDHVSDVGLVTEAEITAELPAFFAVTAYDAAGNESGFSEELRIKE